MPIQRKRLTKAAGVTIATAALALGAQTAAVALAYPSQPTLSPRTAATTDLNNVKQSTFLKIESTFLKIDSIFRKIDSRSPKTSSGFHKIDTIYMKF